MENRLMSWDKLPWIGTGIVLAAVVSFAAAVVRVRRNQEPRSALLGESVQDISLVCLGVAFTFDSGTTPRVVLMGVFVLLFGGYLGIRIWRHARGITGDRPESE